ncbi:g4573 [Coccomyxa viridis]|uniref:Translocon-associated protein subunit alpha n=1 Tax=Coccomyxa viridis TaxID=1274662 RepID=A0ABP1FSW6_9CHLO
MARWHSLGLIVAVLCISAAHGQYSYHQAWSSMLTDMPDSLPGVQTNFWFPEHSDLLFPAGAVVETVVGVHNGGSSTINITALAGSLNNAKAFSQHFQNFTAQEQHRLVGPGEEASLNFWFQPDATFPAREFQVALSMFYTAETGRQHATTFFNRTIDVVEPHAWVDFQAIFLVVLILAGIGGLGYLAYLGLVQSGWVKPRKAGRMTRKVETKKKEVNSDEWLKGTYYNQGARKASLKAKAAPVRAEAAPVEESVPVIPKKAK